MYLTGLSQRRRLFNIAMRWLTDDPGADDARSVTEIFVYEGALAVPAARRFMDEIYGEVFDGPLSRRPIRYKHELREAALEAIGEPTPRQYQLMQAYHDNPEAFFPRMPMDGAVIEAADGRMVGTMRIKRPRRVAEKTSRRMAEFLVGEIRSRAEELARRRAARHGVSMERLGPSPREEEREFVEAERHVAEAFRRRTIRIPADALHIDDVIGFKIIGTEDDLERAESAIARHPAAVVAEREEHRGPRYSAVNILVDLTLPPVAELACWGARYDWSFAAHRGLDPDQVRAGMAAYADSGARAIRIELILTTFDEFLESELGRSIHEYRVLEQRNSREYRGGMAKNGELVIEFLLSVAFAPTVEIDEIPVKMWGQYLPETLSHAIRRLHRREHYGLIVPPLLDRC